MLLGINDSSCSVFPLTEACSKGGQVLFEPGDLFPLTFLIPTPRLYLPGPGVSFLELLRRLRMYVYLIRECLCLHQSQEKMG